MSSPFVHLHLHTEYSIVDGIVRIGQLIDRAHELNMPALAVTELGNMFSTVKFYRAAESRGIKPVIGAELLVHDEAFGDSPYNIVLLCQDLTGYRNLCALITRSYTSGLRKRQACIHEDWLSEHASGLMAMSCANNGGIAHALRKGNYELAKRTRDKLLSVFEDRFCIEVVRCGRADEEYYIEHAAELAGNGGIPLLASNDIRFMKPEDHEAHEVRVCIHQGRMLSDARHHDEYTPQQYFRPAEEMQELFRDLPEAIENTGLVARRCNLELELDTPYMPDFPVPGEHDQNTFLIQNAEYGLRNRVFMRADLSSGTVTAKDYEDRLQRELHVITSMGFAGYFLIVADFIRWAKDQGIPVGPGRGSGAGSLVAYALGITALDPLEYELLFERFLNPERVSLPDFDIDFCMERRDDVITYVIERYGRDRVSQIITYGRMAAKAVVRDVGRVLGHSYGYVDQIAKMIPFDLNMTLERALAEEDDFRERYENDEEARILIDLARKLEGLCRNAGRHAGGVVIAPEPLTDYMPLYSESAGSSTVTQFDMLDVEAIGLVKFDFLGLRTLTIIDKAVRIINESFSNNAAGTLDISRLTLDDSETFDLIRNTDTTAVFQLESDGMRKLIKRLQPDDFEDLIALVALFRPGPLQSGMVDDFIERKHGKARVSYALPILEQVLKPTYGVILYQEQVMQIAQLMAGYSLGAADLLRRAMGKKKPEEMAMQRSIFIQGSIDNGINEQQAASIFDLMEKFAGYGFNRSHSAAYALIAYQTAWLKAHHPAAFMAAVLTSDMDNTDKVVQLCEEVKQMGLMLAPPCVNASQYEFSVADENTIRYGLGAIKGVGRNAVESIISSRPEGGFSDLLDFCRRCELKKVNKRVVESMIRSGAMDCFNHGRGRLLASLDTVIQYAEQSVANLSTGQNDMFGMAESSRPESYESFLSKASFVSCEITEVQRLQGEKDTLGFYLTGHPIDLYEDELNQFVTSRLSALNQQQSGIIVAGYISSIRTRAGRYGRMAEVKLDDKTARMPAMIYPEVYQKYRQLLIKDDLIVAIGKVESDDFYSTGHVIVVSEIMSLTAMRAKSAHIRLKIRRCDKISAHLDELRELLSEHVSGRCRIMVDYYNGEAYTCLYMGDAWRVTPNDRLLENLCSYLGPENVRIQYNNVTNTNLHIN